MQAVTLAVALLVSGVILLAPRRYAFPIFLGALAWYPCYLAVSIGTVDFPVARILVLALLAKAVLARADGPSVSLGWVDMCIVGSVAGGVLANVLSSKDVGPLFENRAGLAFDTMLPYFAARLLIRRREDCTLALRSLLVIAAPLALFGAYQCVSGWNPIGFVRQYSFFAATAGDRALEVRNGFWRAEATFGEPIMFGLFFAMLGPLCAGAWGYVRQRSLLLGGLVLLFLGVASSVSSGPWLATIVACGGMALYGLRQHWKVVLVLVVVWLAAIDVGSNRHWYDVLAEYCTFNSGNSWYRTELMRVALGGGMGGHWLAGFGPFTDPGWGRLIDGRSATWLVNQYLVVLVSDGLLGLLPFLGVVGGSFVALRRGYTRTFGAADRWLVWGIGASLSGMLAALFSVSLTGQMRPLFFILCALGVNVGEALFFAPGRAVSGRSGEEAPRPCDLAERRVVSV